MQSPAATLKKQPHGVLVWAALVTVYLVWGSTYLAIRVMVETLPPLLASGVRFVIAGALFYVLLWARRGRGSLRISGREAVGCGLVGALLLLGGNGLVSIAEKDVPSALAALIIASTPLWVILIRTVTGDRVGRATLAAVAVGFVGVAILVLPGTRPDGVAQLGLVLLLIASLSWAMGSFVSQRIRLPKDPMVSTAYQMLLGGGALTFAGLVRGEGVGLDVASFSGASLAAFAYLVVIGSLVAFTAYVWLLQNAPISRVATYAYVNPVVAIFLGWIILSEAITTTILVGAAVIVVSVAFTLRSERPRTAPEVVEAPAPIAAAEAS